MSRVTGERIEVLLQKFAEHVADGAPAPAIGNDEAIAVTSVMHEELDKGVAMRAERFTQMGHTVACAKGCTSCCEQVVVVAEPEAILAARWLARPEQAAARQRFVAAHARWRGEGGELVEAARAAAANHDAAALSEATVAAFQIHLLCPFNHEGACDIYPVRPAVCREKEALDSQEPCKHGGAVKVASFVPITQFMQRLRGLEDAMQRALPGAPPTRVPLADRVLELLGERKRVSLNAPCPCGSGKKYKRCCGKSDQSSRP